MLTLRVGALTTGRGKSRGPSRWSTQALELSPGKFDFVEMTSQTVLRRDAVTGQPVWDASSPKDPYASGHDPAPWVRRVASFGWGLRLIEPAVDLDGDGTRDILAVVADANAFFALSGKDGERFGTMRPSPMVPGGRGPKVRPYPRSRNRARARAN